MTEGWGSIDVGGDLTLDGRTWEDAIPPEERLGGPSEWGNSRWKVFLQCPWKYWVKYVLGAKMTVQHPRYESLLKNLWIGGLYHEARARYYLENLKHVNQRGVQISDVDQVVIDEDCVKAMYGVVDLAETIQPLVAAEVRRLLMGWVTLYGPGTSRDDRCATMYIENLIETQEYFPYTTRLDRVFWDDEVGAVIQEHKTASWYSETLLASYRTDPQILGQIYCWEHSDLRASHGPLAAVEIDIAVKARQREYYRHRVPVNMDAVEDWARSMRLEKSLLENYQAINIWPRRRANCFMWARACELHEVCAECPGTEASMSGEFPYFAVSENK